MLTILHGDNVVKSRQTLWESLESSKKTNKEIVRLEAKKINLADLEQALGSNDLFGTSQVIVIDGLSSLPRSKKKTAMMELVKTADTEVILWEKKKLTPAVQKSFASVDANIQAFNLTNTLFAWLDSLESGRNKQPQLKMLHQAIEANGEMMCFAMLSRQIRLLIQAKENHKIAGPPFMVGKLKKQAQSFSIEKLTELHHELFVLDKKIKTSTNQLTIAANLDLFILKM